MISVKSLTALITYGAIWVYVSVLAWQFSTIYLIFGGLGFVPKITRIGKKRTLTLEYIGLIIVFCGYAMVENQYIANDCMSLTICFSRWQLP